MKHIKYLMLVGVVAIVAAACSSGAMVFGDINDKESKVAHLKEDKRMYHLLESVGTKPNVMYQAKVRNTSES